MDKVVIIGGKGTAVVLAEQIYDARSRFDAPVEFLGFAFDDESFGTEINGFPILCKTTDAVGNFAAYDDVKFLFSLYRPDLMEERARLRDGLSIPSEKHYTFIHPSAMIAKSALIGPGSAICANVVVNPNVIIGRFNTLNSSCLIGHDTRLGDSNFLAGHACLGSNVVIGTGAFVGLNASIRNFIQVGDYAIIGMASNVVREVAARTVIIGNPGRATDGLKNSIR